MAVALGATIALAAGPMTESLRARRAKAAVLSQVRHDSSLGFILALVRPNDSLHAISVSPSNSQDRPTLERPKVGALLFRCGPPTARLRIQGPRVSAVTHDEAAKVPHHFQRADVTVVFNDSLPPPSSWGRYAGSADAASTITRSSDGAAKSLRSFLTLPLGVRRPHRQRRYGGGGVQHRWPSGSADAASGSVRSASCWSVGCRSHTEIGWMSTPHARGLE